MSAAAILVSATSRQAVDARQVQEQVQQAVAQAQAQAAQAAERAAQAAQAASTVPALPAPPAPPGVTNVTAGGDGRVTVANPDGSTTILNPDGSSMHVRANGQVEYTGVPGAPDDGIPQSVENVIEGFFFTIAFIAVGMPLARAFGRRLDRSGPKARALELSPELNERVERIEHAVDSIAVEVERISEGQRFTTKLLTDRGDAAALERQSARKDAVGGVVR